MMKLVLEECKRLGFKKIRINCNDLNYPSKKLIINNGGVIDENKKIIRQMKELVVVIL